jgi:hypothetical protein
VPVSHQQQLQLAGSNRSQQLQQQSRQQQQQQQLQLPARSVHPAAGLFLAPAPARNSGSSDIGMDPAGQALADDSQAYAGQAAAQSTAADGGGYSSSSGPGGRKAAAKAGAVAVFDKKVYVSLYADGPTKVLCFSDSPLAGLGADDEGGTQQLMSRLHQAARQLAQVDRQLGVAGLGLRTARGSCAVPAALLFQQQSQQQQQTGQSQQRFAGMEDAMTAGALMPLALHPPGSSRLAGGMTTAAVTLLQQMSLQQAQAWASPEAAALAATAGQYLSESDMRQVGLGMVHC